MIYNYAPMKKIYLLKFAMKPDMIYNYAPMKGKNLFIKTCYEGRYDIYMSR